MRLLGSPLAWLLLALLLLLGGQRTWRLPLRIAGVLLLAASWLAMTPAGANWLVGRIEREATALPGECANVEWLVLLAGGLARAPGDAGDAGALSADSLRRVFALRAQPTPAGWRRAVSGGGPHAVAEATLIDALLHRLDPGGATALLETQSTTTWESAQAMATLLPPPRRIALATGALHLPRARLAFEAAGFEVCRWPLDRRHLAVSGISAWWPQSSALVKSEAALHELFGTAYYRWLAWRSGASSSS